MAETVSLLIKISDSGTFKKVEVDVDSLKDSVKAVKEEADRLNNSVVNWAQASQAVDLLQQSVVQLQSVVTDLTKAYQVQLVAETQLQTVMRQRMSATDAEIESVKQLCSEQQKLGVVGDEVQLSGAQQIATFLNEKASLDTLIPAMNDLIAKEGGLNATTEQAISVGNMMGKAMQGQVTVLQRAGITFTDAQAGVMKFGSESEKAAMLAEIITDNIGHMNAALAATDAGKQQQLAMAMGDFKEKIGGLAQHIAPLTSVASQFVIIAGGAFKCVTTMKSLTAAFKATVLGTKLLAAHSRVTASAQRMLAGANGVATVSTRALTAATVGLYAAMTFGLSVAITGIVALIGRLTSSSKDAAEGLDGLREAQDAMKQSYGEAKSEIDSEIASLRKLIEAGGDTSEAIGRLNDKYSEVFGYHSTAAGWYDTLTQKSEAYCRQLGYEAKAKSLSAKIGALIVERDEKQKKADENTNKYRRYGVVDPVTREVTVKTTTQETRVYARQKKEVARLNEQIEALTSEMQASYEEAAKSADQLKAKNVENADAAGWQAMSYTELGKAIEEQKKKLGAYSDASRAEAKQEKATLQAMQSRYGELGKALGLVTENVSKAVSGIKSLQEAADRIPVTYTQPLVPIHPTAVTETPPSLRKYENQLSSLREMRLDASKDMIPLIDKQIARVQKLKDKFEGVNQTVTQMPKFSEGWNGIKGVGNSIRDVTNALKEDNDAWTKLTVTIDGFIGIAQGLQAIIKVIDGISAATKAMAAANSTASAQNVASNAAETTSNISKAASGAAGSVSSIPIVGPALAIAAVAAVLASLASLPKFASGGIVYGPTLGLMGEYGGASSNPEVIAPLSRLRSLIGGERGVNEVRFRIEGRELVGIARKQNNIDRRTK